MDVGWIPSSLHKGRGLSSLPSSEDDTLVDCWLKSRWRLTKNLADVGVVHVGAGFEDLASFFLRPHHERVHRSLNVRRAAGLLWRRRSGNDWALNTPWTGCTRLLCRHTSHTELPTVQKQVRKVLWTWKGVRATAVTSGHYRPTHAELTSGHAFASCYSCCMHSRGLLLLLLLSYRTQSTMKN